MLDKCSRTEAVLASIKAMTSSATKPDASGHFGEYGGRFVPETLMAPLEELTSAFNQAQADQKFHAELAALLADYAGRPTPLFLARRLTEQGGGARIYLKREDLLHTGAHKINNALGQGLLAARMGKTRLIAETGAGHHGVAGDPGLAAARRDLADGHPVAEPALELVVGDVRDRDITVKFATTKEKLDAARLEATQRGWATNLQHLEAKKKGRADFYTEYKLQICKVERETSFIVPAKAATSPT